MPSTPRDFGFVGGLNLAGLTIALKPGEATLLENYECLPLGGYRRHDGYERYDGQPEPSLATWYRIPIVGGTAGLVLGATITGLTSGAVGSILAMTITSGSLATSDAVGEVVVRQLSGLFFGMESLLVDDVSVALSTDDAAKGGSYDEDFDELAILCADVARAPIQPVPGSGSILGVAIFRGLVYAFRNAADGTTAAMYVSSPNGWTLAKSGLAPNGRYEFRIGNFYAGSGTRYLYGVSGVHQGFEWTGTDWNDVTTGMADDRPTHLEIHKNYLFYAFAGGSVQNSGAGTPLVWTVRTGAQEFGTGDEITGMKSIVGGVLVIYCRSSTWLFTGSSSADWALTINAPDSGAFPFSIQSPPGKTVAVDQRGIMPLQTTQAFGDFEAAAVSQRIQPLLDIRSQLLVDSVVVKGKSQYRIFYSDGTIIVVSFKGSTIIGYSPLRYPVNPSCAAQGLDASGREMIVMGSDNGFVYRTDVGMSFDGVAIAAPMRTASDAINGTRQIKHFQNLILQVSTPRPLTLSIQAEYDYGLSDDDISQPVDADASLTGGGWDTSNWDTMTFDVGDERPTISEPTDRIDGVGRNVSFSIYHGDEIRPAFTLESGTIMYSNRGIRR